MARKLLLFHLLSFCCLLSANATGQIPDLIIVGKDTMLLLATPIEHDSILCRQVDERLSKKTFVQLAGEVIKLYGRSKMVS